MRISGGEFKGHIISRPSSETTRPITSRAKEAVFDVLGDISGLSVLDLYSGSGALGIEAISRGADSVVAVEREPQVAEMITNNYEKLGISEKLQLQVKPASIWCMHSREKFDLIFADPPFDELDTNVLSKLPDLMNENGTVVVRFDRRQEVPEIPVVELKKTRRYGSSRVAFYK